MQLYMIQFILKRSQYANEDPDNGMNEDGASWLAQRENLVCTSYHRTSCWWWCSMCWRLLKSSVLLWTECLMSSYSWQRHSGDQFHTHKTTNSCRHNKEFTASTHPFSAPSLSWSNWFIIHEDVEAECKVISSLSVTRDDWRPLELSPHPLLSPGASAQAQVSDIHARVNLEVSVLGWFKFVFTCVTGISNKVNFVQHLPFYAVTNYFAAN